VRTLRILVLLSLVAAALAGAAAYWSLTRALPLPASPST